MSYFSQLIDNLFSSEPKNSACARSLTNIISYKRQIEALKNEMVDLEKSRSNAFNQVQTGSGKHQVQQYYDNKRDGALSRLTLLCDELTLQQNELQKGIQGILGDLEFSNLKYHKYLKYTDPKRTRDRMPQINQDDVEDIVQHFINQDIKVKVQFIPVKELKPIQSEFNNEKILGCIADLEQISPREFVISNDKFLTDNNHYWASLLEVDDNFRVKCYVVDLNISDLLKRLNLKKETHNKDVDDKLKKAIEADNYGAVCIIRNSRGKILTLLRGPEAPWEPNKWFLPGGTSDDKNESPYDLVRREILEETNITLPSEIQLIGVREEADWNVFCFFAQMDDPQVKLNYEHEEFAWLEPEEIKQLDHPVEILEHFDYLERLYNFIGTMSEWPSVEEISKSMEVVQNAYQSGMLGLDSLHFQQLRVNLITRKNSQ